MIENKCVKLNKLFKINSITEESLRNKIIVYDNV